ncbi:MAG TPA: nucleotide exchange factor GrpE, partial [Myxococcaceae bacterium]|nr:nucleotide exchange factor GrpE [Myxococcaceae bacterium]
STELPPNYVLSELVPGYTLADRLLRPAVVSVTKAPAAEQQKPQPEAGADSSLEQSPFIPDEEHQD